MRASLGRGMRTCLRSHDTDADAGPLLRSSPASPPSALLRSPESPKWLERQSTVRLVSSGFRSTGHEADRSPSREGFRRPEPGRLLGDVQQSAARTSLSPADAGSDLRVGYDPLNNYHLP